MEGYGPEFDQWYSIKDLDNAKELVYDYEKSTGSTLSIGSPPTSTLSSTAVVTKETPAITAPAGEVVQMSKVAPAETSTTGPTKVTPTPQSASLTPTTGAMVPATKAVVPVKKGRGRPRKDGRVGK